MTPSINLVSWKLHKPVRLMLALAVSSTMVLSGCQATKSLFSNRDNGSLDYQNSKKLAPLTLPAEQETAPFVPLYPTPDVGVNTLQLTNESGKQYKLPRPERAVPMPDSNQ